MQEKSVTASVRRIVLRAGCCRIAPVLMAARAVPNRMPEVVNHEGTECDWQKYQRWRS